MDFKTLFKGILSNSNRQNKYFPLQRPGDVEFETRWQSAAIERQGHKIIHFADTKQNEHIIVYRLLYDDGVDDEDIMLWARVYSVNGVKAKDPQMFLIYNPDTAHMDIADIRVDVEDAGRGYGSALMTGLFKVITHFDPPVKVISGWLAPVDWDHIDRSVSFYRKHGFECELNHDARSGKILWKNPDVWLSEEEFKNLS